jgi:FAD/FMN-containing dehydrogenase
MLDVTNAGEIEAARQLNERLVMRALRLGGTCSGEHGIGRGKMKYLEIEQGPAIELMRTLKRAFDPDNRMNPGKMLNVS